MMPILERHRITHLFIIGGNDSAETAHALAGEAKTRDQGLR